MWSCCQGAGIKAWVILALPARMVAGGGWWMMEVDGGDGGGWWWMVDGGALSHWSPAGQP